jgi:HEAT repeat protein
MRKRVARSLWILLVASIIWIGAIGLAVLSLARSLKGDPISLSFNADVVRCLPGAKRAALPVLLNALQNADSQVRWNAGSALGFLRFRPSEVVPTLIGLLGHENPGVRWNACFLLGNLGDEAEPAISSLIAVVQDERAGEILNERGARSGKGFYEVFKDHSVRSAAAEALGKIGPIARPAVPSLIQALKDVNPFVRLDAAVAMRRIEGNGARAVPVLIDLLTERSETQRQELLWSEAANALGEIGPDAKQAVPALIRVLSLGSGEARDQAASALGKIGSLAKAAEPELLKALKGDRSHAQAGQRR